MILATHSSLLTAALVLVTSAGALLPSWATASPIYRCGNSFSQVPCPQAQVVTLRDDRPRAEDVQATREVARREARLVEEMGRDRQQRERRAARQGAGSLSRSTEPTVQAKGKDTQDGQPINRSRSRKSARSAPGDDFVAVVPGTGQNRQR